MADQHAHIPSEEIERDIADTEIEIAAMELELAFFEATPPHMRDYRWNQMRAAHRRAGIAERREFIEKLKAILAGRAAIVEVRNG